MHTPHEQMGGMSCAFPEVVWFLDYNSWQKNASFFIYSIELFTWSQYQMFLAASQCPPDDQYIRSRTTMKKQIEPFEVWNARTEPGKLENRRIHHRVCQFVPSPATKVAWIDHCWCTRMQRLLVGEENKSEKAKVFWFCIKYFTERIFYKQIYVDNIFRYLARNNIKWQWWQY